MKSRQDVAQVLIANYPESFSEYSSSIPFDVCVNLEDSKGNFWGFLSYLVTLGILPGGFGYIDDCSIEVVVDGLKDPSNQKERIQLRSRARLTAMSPVGLILAPDMTDYNGEKRDGRGIMVAPHLYNSCKNNLRDVFVSEVASGIAVAISKKDKTTSLGKKRSS